MWIDHLHVRITDSYRVEKVVLHTLFSGGFLHPQISYEIFNALTCILTVPRQVLQYGWTERRWCDDQLEGRQLNGVRNLLLVNQEQQVTWTASIVQRRIKGEEELKYHIVLHHKSSPKICEDKSHLSYCMANRLTNTLERDCRCYKAERHMKWKNLSILESQRDVSDIVQIEATRYAA